MSAAGEAVAALYRYLLVARLFAGVYAARERAFRVGWVTPGDPRAISALAEVIRRVETDDPAAWAAAVPGRSWLPDALSKAIGRYARSVEDRGTRWEQPGETAGAAEGLRQAAETAAVEAVTAVLFWGVTAATRLQLAADEVADEAIFDHDCILLAEALDAAAMEAWRGCSEALASAASGDIPRMIPAVERLYACVERAQEAIEGAGRARLDEGWPSDTDAVEGFVRSVAEAALR